MSIIIIIIIIRSIICNMFAIAAFIIVIRIIGMMLT